MVAEATTLARAVFTAMGYSSRGVSHCGVGVEPGSLVPRGQTVQQAALFPACSLSLYAWLLIPSEGMEGVPAPATVRNNASPS